MRPCLHTLSDGEGGLKRGDADLLLCLLMEFLFVFLFHKLLRLAMGHKKAYIVHLSIPSLYSLEVGQACIWESIAKSGKPEYGHGCCGASDSSWTRRRDEYNNNNNNE